MANLSEWNVEFQLPYQSSWRFIWDLDCGTEHGKVHSIDFSTVVMHDKSAT